MVSNLEAGCARLTGAAVLTGDTCSFVGWGARYGKDHIARGSFMSRADGVIVGTIVFRCRDFGIRSPTNAPSGVSPRARGCTPKSLRPS